MGLLAGFLAGSTGIFACSIGSDHTASGDSNVTSIPQTPVTDQSYTGSCWLYSTANWIESMHMSANAGQSVHYSPAYWMYWELYRELTTGEQSVDFGGFWGRAADIMLNYGMMPLGSFVIDDVNAQYVAVESINAKIQAGLFGPLNADGGLSPRDPTLVRAILDEVFKLGNDTRALLNKTFGADGTHTFQTGATPNGAITRPADLTVWSPVAGQGASLTTLDKILGQPNRDPNASPDDRVGDGTWTAAYPPTTDGLYAMMQAGAVPGNKHFKGHTPGGLILGNAPKADIGDGGAAPSDNTDGGAADVKGLNPIAGMNPLTPPDPVKWRAYWKRVQKALHDGVPLPMAWSVIDQNIDAMGHFKAGPQIIPMSGWGGHEVIITDYQVTNVPNYGTLPVGTAANYQQEQAALDDKAVIQFFRVKNSWGTNTQVTGFQTQAGYNDVDTDYLTQPLDLCDDSSPDYKDAGPTSDKCWAMAPQIWDVILPPGY
jgi:hypothetical protein